MSHNFPQNRDDIGVKIFPHDDLIKRGDPEYFHYVPASAQYGDKYLKKAVSPGSGVSPRVEVRRSDLNQSPGHVHSSYIENTKASPVPERNSTGHNSYEASPDYGVRHETKPLERKLDLDAIEDHLQHHGRLEKLDDFNVDVTPSPQLEEKPFVHVSDIVREVESHEHGNDFSTVEEVMRDSAKYVNEQEQQHVEHDTPRHVHEQAEHVVHAREQDEDGYELVSQTHVVGHDHEIKTPDIEIQDNLLQTILHREYGSEFTPSREDDHSVLHQVDEYEKTHGEEHESRRNEHHVAFDDRVTDHGLGVTEHRSEHVYEEPSLMQHESTDHAHHDQHSMQHHIEHHLEKYGSNAETHEHKDQHSIEHHMEHHKIKQEEAGIQQHQEPHRMEPVEINYGIAMHQHASVEEPREHDGQLNTVKQMVNEHERKHKDEHSMEHHIQHHKAKQLAQESSQHYQPRETTMELHHERHEVRLNIEVKHQAATHLDTAYSEPKTNTVYMEVKQDVTPTRIVEQQYTETRHEGRTEQQYTETRQEITPTRREQPYQLEIDSPTKLKTDAIIAQLKSVGVDAGGVKTLKDLKEEKRLMQIRKEEELKAEIERIKREYTADKYMNASPTHHQTGFELPEWKRRQIAQKKAEEAAKEEEARLWKEFEEWKLGQSPSWVKDAKNRKSQP